MKERLQVNVIVRRNGDRKRPTWRITIYSGGMGMSLVEDFKTLKIARYVATAIANGYRLSGCNVALDLKGRK